MDEKNRYTTILEQSLANIKAALASDATEDVEKFFSALHEIFPEKELNSPL